MAQAATTKMSREEADALRKQAASLRQQIIESALKSPELGEVELISQFRRRHQELQEQAAASEGQIKWLEKARTQFAPVEQDVQQKQQVRDQLINSLPELHRPLGTAAFEGHLAGNLSELPVLAARLEVHQRIESLRQEYDAQAPSADAGIVDSTKAKALQLATAGKIKLEEMKVGQAETLLGQKLIESKEEASANCDQTQEVLSKLSQRRIEIAEREQQYDAAHFNKEAMAAKLVESLELKSVTSCRDLDAETSRCQQVMRQNGTDAKNAQSQLITLLLSDGSQVPQGGTLAKTLEQLRGVEIQLEQAPSSFHLDKKVWYGIGGAAVLLMMMMMCCGVLGVIGNRMSAAAAKDVAAANELWETGQEEEAATKYRSLIDSSWDFVDDADRPTVLQRTIDFDLLHGNDASGKALIEKALDAGITLSLKSPEAKTLLAQVKQVRRETEERDRIEREELEREIAQEKRKEKEEQRRLRLAGQSKLKAFSKVADKWNEFPDRFASQKTREKYNAELDALQEEFIETPLHIETDVKDAITIIERFEKEIEGRYDGQLYYVLEEEIRDIASVLLQRDN